MSLQDLASITHYFETQASLESEVITAKLEREELIAIQPQL